MGKWVGVVISAAVAALWIINYWWGFGYVHATRSSEHVGAGVECGVLVLVSAPVNNPVDPQRPGWFGRTNDGHYVWLPHVFASPSGRGIWLPLWMLLLATVLPCACLWCLDRRVRLGHCPCGYNLAGLAPDGACPECGRSPATPHSPSTLPP